MAKFVFGREVKMECDCTVGKEMGVNTWAAFAGSDDNAVVDGDFATTAPELQAVLKISPERRHQHRGDPLAHDRGNTAHHFPPLLGPWQSRESGGRHQKGDGDAE